ncbi:MAG: DegT/DnrJ/EryC1/StrS family aminotransferase [candidate division WOR-3 bacterium]|nr:DegT/DnrJ/EryC1/StrS family aminotransferase [candidate division WOR-3 bacterium]
MSETRPLIPVARPWLDEQEAEAARRVILSGWVTQGPEVRAFEEEFAAAVGARHAYAVSSCTTALHLALKAIGVGPGDEVITVSHSFIATANSIRYCGAVPVFVDIEPHTFNMNPVLIEPAITERTKAILCVHQMGMPSDLRSIIEIAHQHGLPVVEDAACAIGSEINWQGEWQRIGRPHGDVACFSFHPRKLLTTGDGGMLTTNNADYDRQFRLWRQHGMSITDTARHTAKSVVFEEYTELGYNYRMTDIQAAIGRVQLKRLPEIVTKRRQLARRYFGLLSSVPGLGLPVEPEWTQSNWQSFCVRLPEGADQRTVMQSMLDAGVATRRGIMNAHLEPAYRSEPWKCAHGQSGDCACLQESEQAQKQSIILPLFHQMTDATQRRITDLLCSCLSMGGLSGR